MLRFKSKKLQWYARVLLWVCVIAFCLFHLLVLYQTAYHLSTNWFWNFTSYFAPVYFVLELFLLAFLLIKKRFVLAFLPLIILTLSMKSFEDTFQLNSPSPKAGENCFKLMTYNIALIPFESLDDDSTYLDTNARDGLFKILKKHSPDILCLQEFHHKDIDKKDVLNQLQTNFGYQYFFMTPVFIEKLEGYSGPIILSKHPIIRDFHIEFTDGKNELNRLLAADIQVGEDTLRFINVHMKSMSIRVNEEEKEGFFTSMVNNIEDIYVKLHDGFIDQKSQLAETYEFVEKSPYPIILCGDFNSLPYSYNYQFLKERLKNTFTEKGTGFGYTLNRFPYFARIDNIFASENVEVFSHEVLNDYGCSDHFPVLVTMGANTLN